MIKNGDTVKVHYTGRLADGTIFDSSREREPMQFTLGSGMLIPGFDRAVLGMEAGESKTVDIPMQEAYGSYCHDLVQEVSKSEIPPGVELEVGQKLQAQNEKGQPVIIEVIKITEATVTLDANHPLAGKNLIFDIELVEVC